MVEPPQASIIAWMLCGIEQTAFFINPAPLFSCGSYQIRFAGWSFLSFPPEIFSLTELQTICRPCYWLFLAFFVSWTTKSPSNILLDDEISLKFKSSPDMEMCMFISSKHQTKVLTTSPYPNQSSYWSLECHFHAVKRSPWFPLAHWNLDFFWFTYVWTDSRQWCHFFIIILPDLISTIFLWKKKNLKARRLKR